MSDIVGSSAHLRLSRCQNRAPPELLQRCRVQRPQGAGIDAVEWAGGIWLARRYRAPQWKLPFWRGKKKRLTGKKATGLRDTTRCFRFLNASANLGLIPAWVRGNERKPLRIRKAKGKMAKERRAKARERTGCCGCQFVVSCCALLLPCNISIQ